LNRERNRATRAGRSCPISLNGENPRQRHPPRVDRPTDSTRPWISLSIAPPRLARLAGSSFSTSSKSNLRTRMLLAPPSWMPKSFDAEDQGGVLGLQVCRERPTRHSVGGCSRRTGLESLRSLGVRDLQPCDDPTQSEGVSDGASKSRRAAAARSTDAPRLTPSASEGRWRARRRLKACRVFDFLKHQLNFCGHTSLRVAAIRFILC
jgi:hypothetical protein